MRGHRLRFAKRNEHRAVWRAHPPLGGPALWSAGLVEAVRGYAGYEQALLATVTELRGNALASQRGAARFALERELGARLQQLVLLQENYPQLKAEANFRDLSAKLVEVEDHLQFARRFYNGAVKQYVTRLETFPDVIVARLFGFRPLPFFETDDRQPVEVTL